MYYFVHSTFTQAWRTLIIITVVAKAQDISTANNDQPTFRGGTTEDVVSATLRDRMGLETRYDDTLN
jgi:hypothetical protein